jgi:hypothetical protein
MEINEIRPFFAKAMHVMIQLAPDRQQAQDGEDRFDDTQMDDDFNLDDDS